MSVVAVDRPTAVDRRDQPQPFAGLGNQLRFVARRDRVRAAVWIGSVVGVVWVSALSVLGLYSTPEDLATYAVVSQADAAFRAIAGPGYGLDDPTEGAVVMNETSLYTYVAVALMAVFLVTRHTRAEEDTGRAELVRAAPVGRLALLAAASVWVTTISVSIGLGLTVALVACGLPLTGSAAFGAASAATGITFTGFAAVAAQLASTSRSANSFGGIVLGVSFLIRAVGDIGTPWLSWCSPLGIAQAIRPYADERWWVLAVLALIAAGSFAGAVILLGRRDLGAGLIGQRPGPATAAPRLATPLALAVRLQRPALVGWTVAMALSGLAFGLVIDQADAFADNDAIADLIAQAGGGSISEQFLALSVMILALVASGFTVAAVLRLRSEEIAGRAEPIMATPTSRTRWWSSHTVVSLAASLLLLTVTGLGLGIGGAASTGRLDDVWPAITASLTMFAPLALVAAITAFAVAVAPRLAPASWMVVAMAVVVGLLGDTLDLPQWLRNLSPFEHVPALPAEDFAVTPLVVLSALAAAALAAGAAAIRHRDIAA